MKDSYLFMVVMVVFGIIVAWSIMETGKLNRYREECEFKKGQVVRTLTGWECVYLEKVKL